MTLEHSAGVEVIVPTRVGVNRHDLPFYYVVKDRPHTRGGEPGGVAAVKSRPRWATHVRVMWATHVRVMWATHVRVMWATLIRRTVF